MNSSVLKWPDRESVWEQLQTWAGREMDERPDLQRLGVFGSYARGDVGVGSDLDLIAIVSTSTKPFEQRSIDWNLTGLPVPADLLVYTVEEWHHLQTVPTRFSETLKNEVVWLSD